MGGPLPLKILTRGFVSQVAVHLDSLSARSALHRHDQLL